MLMNAALLHPGPPHVSEGRVVGVMVVAGSVAGVMAVAGSVVGGMVVAGSLFEDIFRSLEIFFCTEDTSSLNVAIFLSKSCC